MGSLKKNSANGMITITTPNLSTVDITDENKERGNWSNKFEFLLSCLSYAVGLGNIWRFPYLCYQNGGGAFLIPYAIMLTFTGVPLFFLELSFGQYASEGPITIWKISPLFQGIGYAMFTVSALVGIYYNMILAWALFYLGSSFTSQLPWSSCDNLWNTHACRKFDTKNCTLHNGVMLRNGSCIYQSQVSYEQWIEVNGTTDNTVMASDEYFHKYVLDISEGVHDLGPLRWQLCLCLLASWIIVFCCLSKGVKSVGKVVYFTAMFPYLVLIVLLIRGFTLEGAMDGVIFYLTPKWKMLLKAKVWGDAAVQIFFSLSPCWGGLITLASYNRFHNNCFRDAVTIAVGNCLTSFFAGFVIFSIIGFMAHELGVDVKDVAKQGASLAFVAYPEAVSRLPISPLWSFLFFFMLLTLGMGTQFTIVETVVTTITDTFPERLRKRKVLVLLGVCTISFFLGLILCSRGGMYILQLMDNYCATFSALVVAFIELLVISWVYGVDRFLDDIKLMIGKDPYPRTYWKVIWKFFTPCLIIAVLFFTWIDFKPTKYGEFVFPAYVDVIGWMLSMLPVCMIPIILIYKVTKSDAPVNLWKKMKLLSAPTEEWGPALQIHRAEMKQPCHIDSKVPLASRDENSTSDFTPTPETMSINIFKPQIDEDDDPESGLQLLVNKETGL